MGNFGQAVNMTSLVFAFFGTTWCIRKLGVPNSLLLFPFCTAIVIITVFLLPQLWTLFVGQVIVKARACCVPAVAIAGQAETLDESAGTGILA